MFNCSISISNYKKRSLTGKMQIPLFFSQTCQFSCGYTLENVTRSHYAVQMTNNLFNHLLLLVKYKSRKIVSEQLFHI